MASTTGWTPFCLNRSRASPGLFEARPHSCITQTRIPIDDHEKPAVFIESTATLGGRPQPRRHDAHEGGVRSLGRLKHPFCVGTLRYPGVVFDGASEPIQPKAADKVRLLIRFQRLIFLSLHNPVSAQGRTSIAEEVGIQNSGVRIQNSKISAGHDFPDCNQSHVGEPAISQMTARRGRRGACAIAGHPPGTPVRLEMSWRRGRDATHTNPDANCRSSFTRSELTSCPYGMSGRGDPRGSSNNFSVAAGPRIKMTSPLGKIQLFAVSFSASMSHLRIWSGNNTA